MTMRPDPTFHASPKLAMEAPPENFAYTLLLSPDFSKPDALAVIDVKPGSPTYSQVVHTVTMPYKGDEFHHFGWNACSSALSPLTGHAFLERRYLIIPGIRSSAGLQRRGWLWSALYAPLLEADRPVATGD